MGFYFSDVCRVTIPTLPVSPNRISSRTNVAKILESIPNRTPIFDLLTHQLSQVPQVCTRLKGSGYAHGTKILPLGLVSFSVNAPNQELLTFLPQRTSMILWGSCADGQVRRQT